MNLSPNVAGIDVSKAKLDVYIHPGNEYRIFDNKEQGFEEILNFLKQRKNLWVRANYILACYLRNKAEFLQKK